ncbi:MAG: hypothetical protein ACK559_37270 [bacterium]
MSTQAAQLCRSPAQYHGLLQLQTGDLVLVSTGYDGCAVCEGSCRVGEHLDPASVQADQRVRASIL